MRTEFIDLTIPAGSAPQTGTPVVVRDFESMYVQLTALGASAGTLLVMGSIDGANYVQVGSMAANTSAFLSVPQTLKYLRVDKSVDIVGGPPAMALGARQGRSEF